MTSEKRLVQIPDGARVTVELNPDQVEAFVQVEIRRQVGEVVRRVLPPSGRSGYSAASAVRMALQHVLREAIYHDDEWHDEETPHQAFERAVHSWLDRRHGWLARQVIRARVLGAGKGAGDE